jgi:hypothetical protein
LVVAGQLLTTRQVQQQQLRRGCQLVSCGCGWVLWLLLRCGRQSSRKPASGGSSAVSQLTVAEIYGLFNPPGPCPVVRQRGRDGLGRVWPCCSFDSCGVLCWACMSVHAGALQASPAASCFPSWSVACTSQTTRPLYCPHRHRCVGQPIAQHAESVGFPACWAVAAVHVELSKCGQWCLVNRATVC